MRLQRRSLSVLHLDEYALPLEWIEWRRLALMFKQEWCTFVWIFEGINGRNTSRGALVGVRLQHAGQILCTTVDELTPRAWMSLGRLQERRVRRPRTESLLTVRRDSLAEPDHQPDRRVVDLALADRVRRGRDRRSQPGGCPGGACEQPLVSRLFRQRSGVDKGLDTFFGLCKIVNQICNGVSCWHCQLREGRDNIELGIKTW